MKKWALLLGFSAALVVGGAVVYRAFAVNANPVTGSVWTWLGPTFGADWVLPVLSPPGPGTINAPESFGAMGDGVTDDTGAVLSCLQASNPGYPCILKNGKTYIVNTIALPDNTFVEGGGTLMRKPGSDNATFLYGSCTGLHMRDVIIHGNKSAETIAADNLYCMNYSGVRLVDVTSKLAKSGNGITLDKSVDQAAQTYSSLNGVFATGNDRHGVTAITAAWYLQLNNTTANYNGQYGAYFGPTGPANNVDSTLQHITVKGGNFSYNANSGLAAQGFISGYVGGNPIWGPGIEPVSNAIFTGVHASNNGYYGLVIQARNSLLSDSIADQNARALSFGGGVLANGEFVDIVNVKSVNNRNGVQGLGLDAGCGIGVHILGGDYSGNDDRGINIGCSSYSSVRGATVTNNGTYAIYAGAAEGAGDGYGIPGYTNTLIISGNRISCQLPGDNYGIVLAGGGLGVEVTDNFVQGCADPFKAIIVYAESARVKNNTVPKSDDPLFANPGGTDYDAPSGMTGTLNIPVWVDSVALYGANSFNTINTGEQNYMLGDKVYSVRVSNGGSGYTQSSVASWTGCTTPPTGTVMVTRDGKLTGYLFTNPTTHGTGCVNPTVSFSIGSGATTVVNQIPLYRSFQKELILQVAGGGTLTMGNTGNLQLASPITSAGQTSTVMLHWGWHSSLYELSRVLH